MKVLYNTCYGGFCISMFAILKLIEKDKLHIWAYKPCSDSYIAINGKNIQNLYERITEDNVRDVNYWSNIVFTNRNVGKTVDKSRFENKLTSDLLRHRDVYDLFYNPDTLRFNKSLIDLFEQYGTEKISGDSCKLDLFDITKGCSFKIDEHDGLETVSVYYNDDKYFYAYE